MSLQELKEHLVEFVTSSKDESELEALADYAALVRESAQPQTGKLTEAELESIRIGEEQIARGEYGTIEDANRAMQRGIERGLERFRQRQNRG